MRECVCVCALAVKKLISWAEWILTLNLFSSCQTNDTRKLILFVFVFCAGYFVINYPNQFFYILFHLDGLWKRSIRVLEASKHPQLRADISCEWFFSIEKNRRKKKEWDGKLSKDLRTNHVQAYWLVHRLICLLARALYTKSLMEFYRLRGKYSCKS